MTREIDPVLAERLASTDSLIVQIAMAERHFLECSVAAWRESDRAPIVPHRWRPKGMSTIDRLRMKERQAWEVYRDLLDG